ncbi:hypothetical protein GCM10022224_017050 [Nonomuraea antimicrobica]|uniref:Uncharacterized protein n=1 Tax=Nonomuraea antimicrobica TaxID=561173 RepID=A0ABP7BAG3_9ACTN
MSFDDACDEQWQHRFARGFVESVRVADQTTSGGFPSAVLHIEVTHRAWLDHVREGDTWESYAEVETWFELAECAPITPDGTDAPIDDPGDSFIAVPRVVWGDWLQMGPALLELPAYAPTAYTTRDRIDDPAHIPADWIGRAVRVMLELHGAEDVSLVDGTASTLAWMHLDGTFGVTRNARITSIARLVPKASRRGGKLTYARVFDHVKAEFVGAYTSGRRIELAFRIAPDRRELDLGASADVLSLLAWGGNGRLATDRQPNTELATALAADAERLDIGDSFRLIDRVADSYVAHYTVTYEPGHDLDDLPPRRIREILTAEWPTARLSITMTDERWATLPHDDTWADDVGTRAITGRP